MRDPNPNTHDLWARESLRLLGPDPGNWVPDRPGIDHNVLIVGGGHTGVALAYGLRRAGVGRVSVIDQADGPKTAGVWRSVARMHKLRTLKNLVGPEGSNPALSFQAWYEARHGRDAYAAIDRIARIDWADYVDWYRGIVGVEVRYGTTLSRIVPQESGLRLELIANGKVQSETARKVVLATGFLGGGSVYVPPVLSKLPATHLQHTSQQIDFAALSGKRVAVVGAAASAFDAAAVALEEGAAAVHLFSRRRALAATAVNKARAYPGAYDHFPRLPDAIRWQQALRYRRSGTTAPADSIERVVIFPNFHVHLDSPLTSAEFEQGQALLVVGNDTFRFDFVIAATGYAVDPALRPELAGFSDHILRWRDRYAPPESERDDELGRYPYLGPGLELRELTPGAAPWLKDIHIYNPAAFIDRGIPVGDVPSMRRDLPAVAARISEDLFLADLDAHKIRFNTTITPDFDEHLYASAIWRPAPSEAAE